MRAGSFTVALTWFMPAYAADPSQIPPVRQHAEQAFEQLNQQVQKRNPALAERPDTPGKSMAADHPSLVSYPPAQYLIGRGQGDLEKGPLVCQRVSELAARTDIAKQIRVLVKERATDRVRERTGREPEQDIEVVREELVQEYLQGVKIVDRAIDEAGRTCSAVAVMPKDQIQSRSAPASARPESTDLR